MGIFKAPKAGSQSGELMVGGLTGVMDLKIFYRGKNRGEGSGAATRGRPFRCSSASFSRSALSAARSQRLHRLALQPALFAPPRSPAHLRVPGRHPDRQRAQRRAAVPVPERLPAAKQNLRQDG